MWALVESKWWVNGCLLLFIEFSYISAFHNETLKGKNTSFKTRKGIICKCTLNIKKKFPVLQGLVIVDKVSGTILTRQYCSIFECSALEHCLSWRFEVLLLADLVNCVIMKWGVYLLIFHILDHEPFPLQMI